MNNRRMSRAGAAVAVLLPLGLIVACADPAPGESAAPLGQAPMMQPLRAYEQPGQTPPGQAPMAEPWEPATDDADHEPRQAPR